MKLVCSNFKYTSLVTCFNSYNNNLGDLEIMINTKMVLVEALLIYLLIYS